MSRYRFGACLLDPESRILLRDGQPVAMAGKTLDLLVLLIERHGKIVDKDELLSRIWPGRMVEEANLTQGICTLRKILGDNPTDHRYIATVAGRGYQFVAPVAELPSPEGPVAAPGGRSAATADPRRNRMLWTGAGFSVLGLFAVAVWFWAGARARSPAVERPQAVPFTAMLGSVSRPAFSPDGKEIAYTWSGEDAANQSIYVKLIGSETHLRLTTPPGSDTTPAWSPDGRFIAFYRKLPGASGYYIVSALGGAVRQILRMDVDDTMARAAWFPDGRRLVVVQPMVAEPPNPSAAFPEFQFRLVSVDIATGQQRALTSPPAGSPSSDSRPVFSPDGKTLAFVRQTHAVSEVYLMPMGGRPWRLTAPGLVTGLDWTADSREIVYSVIQETAFDLWRMPISGGPARWITSSAEFLADPTVARQGGRLAYALAITNESLWRVDLSGSDPPKAGPPKPTMRSTQAEIDPMYSPDGRKVAFSSDRTGTWAIWVSDPDGRDPLQLTHGTGLWVGSPRWSPNGSLIAFDSVQEGKSEIYVVPAGGGDPRRITRHQADDVVPGWSRDGKWIYFASNRSGNVQIWKAPAATGESLATPALQVTQGGGFNAIESADGKYLYFAVLKGPGKAGLWRRPLAIGPEACEEPVLESLQYWGIWALGPNGIFFLEHPDGLPNANADLKYMDLVSGRITRLLKVDKPMNWQTRVITVSPDGRHLIYEAYGDLRRSNIVLVEGFR